MMKKLDEVKSGKDNPLLSKEHILAALAFAANNEAMQHLTRL